MKIGIVNDMPLAVEALRRALAHEPRHQVVWVAHDGREALQCCLENTPDVVLMDLLMPVMNGVEATRLIMAQAPCAILIVTADIQRNMGLVFEAMGHGALDVVDTPSLGGPQGLDSSTLLRKLHNISWVIGQPDKKAATIQAKPRATENNKRLVAIGASAGGPASLLEVLKQLPVTFNAAIVLVQHVDAEFAAGMAHWLSSESQMPVRLACDGESPKHGEVLLAGTNNHLCLQAGGRLVYAEEPLGQIYRPSIDVFFDSLAQHWRGDAVGVLLTGMGRDGAQGLKHMRERGFLTLAQDQKSCAVYGMPKAAAAIDAADEILPLVDIAPRLMRAFG